jgi:hypothetical protein
MNLNVIAERKNSTKNSRTNEPNCLFSDDLLQLQGEGLTIAIKREMALDAVVQEHTRNQQHGDDQVLMALTNHTTTSTGHADTRSATSTAKFTW